MEAQPWSTSKNGLRLYSSVDKSLISKSSQNRKDDAKDGYRQSHEIKLL